MNSSTGTRKRASTPKYVSPNQLTLCGFETPFEQKLNKENRWVKMSHLIPWDKIVKGYDSQFKSLEGRPPISGRIVIGAVIIKHLLNLTDEETINQIQENMFMQYFLGYSSFTNEAPFSSSLFVEIRGRLSLEVMNGINDVIIATSIEKPQPPVVDSKDAPSDSSTIKDNTPSEDVATTSESGSIVEESIKEAVPVEKNQGKLLMDATVAPQNITYSTDLKLLNSAREKSEELIDKLYRKELHGDEKVRTYRENARKDFLNSARKKTKGSKEIYRANGSQLRYLKRNLSHITFLLKAYLEKGIRIGLKQRDMDYLHVLELVYQQQYKMHTERVNKIENRIVNIHQSYVRPIVRGKEGKKVEFGSKIQASLVNGFVYLDKLSWDNFNEGTCLLLSVELYKKRFGFYPAEVLVDQIYCTQENRRALKARNIKLMAKPLGRPSKQALDNHVRPGERNPIEGKFGQGKVKYGLANICTKLKATSESCIASIMLVLNLVNLTRLNLVCLYQGYCRISRCHFGIVFLGLSC